MRIAIATPKIIIDERLRLSPEILAQVCTSASSLACNSLLEGHAVEDFKQAGYVRSITISRYGGRSSDMLNVKVFLAVGSGLESKLTFQPEYVCQISSEEIVFTTEAFP